MLTAEWRYPSFGAPIESHTVTVSTGVELPAATIQNDSKFDIDIGDDWVEFRFNLASGWTGASFNGWHFRDASGSLGPITSYTLDSFSAGVSNTGMIVTGFNDDEFWANFSGISIAGPGEWIRLKVVGGDPGTAFCFGDGSAPSCPCGNLDQSGGGCANSTIVGAVLGTGGTNKVASNDLVLLGSQLPPNIPALFFSGASVLAPGSFFGDGIRCAGGQITRLQVVFTDLGGNAASSIGIASTLGATPGTNSIMQLWYRDNGGPCGSGFNTSNAIDLTWQ